MFFVLFGMGQSLLINAQSQLPFDLELKPINISGAPSLHSGALVPFENKWIYIGGRTNGLHGFQPPFAFLESGENSWVWVIDPHNDRTYSASVDSLDENIKEAITSSNMQWQLVDSTLYMVGGYGFKSRRNDFVTFETVTIIDLPELVDAVMNETTIRPWFQQGDDSRLAVCGAHMVSFDSTLYLVFGHDFDGRYDVDDFTGFFTQEYTHEIRQFRISNSGGRINLEDYEAVRDTNNFRRRDYNLVPQIFSDGTRGFTAFSGVFQKNTVLPYLSSIDITADGYVHQDTFRQHLSHYHSAVMPIYDSAANSMHTIFFGGMSMYFIDSTTGALAVDSLVPFVNTISMVTRDSIGALREYVFPNHMPALLGTNAHFIPVESLANLHDEILNISQIEDSILAGHVYGGIESPAPNISEIDASLSNASPYIFEVWLYNNDTLPTDTVPVDTVPVDTVTALVSIPAQPFEIDVSPNPSSERFQIQVSAALLGEIKCEVIDLQGKLIETLYFGYSKRKLKLTWEASAFSAGIYYFRVTAGNYEATHKLSLE